MAEWWTPSPSWSGETCAILASGPSLTAGDARRAGESCKVIAINDAWRVWPAAEILYSCDAKWWVHHQNVPGYYGLKVTLDAGLAFRDVKCLKRGGQEGFNPDPAVLNTGMNSGFQAVHLAMHLGVRRILLLGYDMGNRRGRTHFFGDHPDALKVPSPYEKFIALFRSLVEPLRERNIEVINCTPDSALPWFTKQPLNEVLCPARSA